MTLQPLHPIDQSQAWQTGEVQIHPGATIAVGVLLQADPGSQIIIESGAILGLGTVVHACRQSTIRIGQAANLGAGVLVVGRVSVGDRAVLGMGSTAIDTDVPAGRTIAPGTLLGNTGRSIGITPPANQSAAFASVVPGHDEFTSDRPDTAAVSNLRSPWDEEDQTLAPPAFSPNFDGNPIGPSHPKTPTLPPATPYRSPTTNPPYTLGRSATVGDEPGREDAPLPQSRSGTSSESAPETRPLRSVPGASSLLSSGFYRNSESQSLESQTWASPAGIDRSAQTDQNPASRQPHPDDDWEDTCSTVRLEVSGKVHVQQLMSMMFPYRQAIAAADQNRLNAAPEPGNTDPGRSNPGIDYFDPDAD